MRRWRWDLFGAVVLLAVLALAVGFASGFWVANDRPPEGWRWIPVRQADDARPRIVRAGWRPFTTADPERAEWAWVARVENDQQAEWRGTFVVAARLIDSGGVVVDRDSIEHRATVPAGATYDVWGRSSLPKHRLTDDVRLRLTLYRFYDP